MAKISVITVTFNSEQTIKKCLNSVLENTDNCEIVVVDNNSTDDTIKILEQYDKKINVIKSDKNLGFSKGNNLGVKQSSGEYLVFLNPDCEVTERGSLNRLVEYLESHKEYGLIGPKIIFPDGRSQNTVRNLPTLSKAISEYIFKRTGSYDFYNPKCSDLCSVESVVGACMAINRELFNKVGGFDEKYFLYFEDLELCKSVLDRGLKVGFLPQTVIRHILGSSGKGERVSDHLINSAKIYHGLLNYLLLNLVIKVGRKING